MLLPPSPAPRQPRRGRADGDTPRSLPGQSRIPRAGPPAGELSAASASREENGRSQNVTARSHGALLCFKVQKITMDFLLGSDFFPPRFGGCFVKLDSLKSGN